MLAVISIGAKVVAMDADPRLWKENDQLALCRDLFRLAERMQPKEPKRRAPRRPRLAIVPTAREK